MVNDKLILKLIGTFCFNAHANGGLLVALVLLFSLPIEGMKRLFAKSCYFILKHAYFTSSIDHGFGFDPLRNGIAFSWFAIVGFIFQVMKEKSTHFSNF